MTVCLRGSPITKRRTDGRNQSRSNTCDYGHEADLWVKPPQSSVNNRSTLACPHAHAKKHDNSSEHEPVPSWQLRVSKVLPPLYRKHRRLIAQQRRLGEMNMLCLHSPYLVTKCGLGSWQVIVVDTLRVIVLMLAQIHRKCWEANLDKGHADWSWTVFREPTACGVGRFWISDHLIYSGEHDMLEQWNREPKKGEMEEIVNFIG